MGSRRQAWGPCLRLAGVLLLLAANQRIAEARSCQIRNFAGEPVDFYWMDVTNWGTYHKQTKRSLANATSAPVKTFETHRFFVAWADEAKEVPTWDPDMIPQHIQFVHRGYDQVVTAKVDADGNLYIDDFDILEGEIDTLKKDIQKCDAEDTEAFADCVYSLGSATIERLEREVSFMEQHGEKVRKRLAESFCGAGKFQSPALRSFQWGKPQVEVDVLVENDDLAIYHLKGYLDDDTVKALNTSGPVKDQRQKDVPVGTSSGSGLFGWGKGLDSLSKRAEAFATDQLQAEVALESSKEEPLRIFRYEEKEIHVPPCDGICPQLNHKPSEYAGTMIAYAGVPSSGGQWRFTTADNQTVGFIPQAKDAVFFHWKKQGYKYDLLPQLVPCAVGGANETMLLAAKWLPAATTELKEKHDEL